MGKFSRTEEQRTIHCQFSEKAIMLCKAALMGDAEHFDKIATTRTPMQCKELGRLVQGFVQERWDAFICSVAFEVCYQKFGKSQGLSQTLLSTGNLILVEAAARDAIWGVKLGMGDPWLRSPQRWQGTNILGWALM